ncbi:dihydroxyacetone kinase subunit DhaK [Escherichia coli]
MGIKQHNGNTKADRLAELKIRSPSIQLIKFGAIGLNAILFSPLLIAADTGSQYGTNITINDGDRITGDTADPSGNLYGVMTPAGNTPGNINLGNDVTVNVNDASGYAKGIIIQGKNSSLTANRLTVDVVGQTSAIGINLIGDYTHADLGTGSTIKSNDDGIIIGHSSTLTATQFTIENSNGIGLTINDYGTSVDLGSGSKIKTDGSTGVYIGGLNGNNANGAARFTATDLTIDVQGYSAMGINVQKNSVVDLGTNSSIKTSGDNAHGLWSFGQVSANALTVDVTGAAANGVEVRGGTTTIGADSHISWQEEPQTKQPLQSGDGVIALVNNLGATPLSELYGVYNRLTTRCQQAGLTIERNLIGAYCTSLDMTGFSITLLKVDDETLALWDAPVHTPALNWGK